MIAIVLTLYLLLPFQDGKETTDAESTTNTTNKEALNDERFHSTLLRIGKEYRKYGRVDDMLRWAPFLCDAPRPVVRPSEAAPKSPHGRKLYSVLAKKPEPYMRKIESKSPVGQILVKESYHPQKAPRRPQREPSQAPEEAFGLFPYAVSKGEVFHAEKKGPLFVMYKEPEDTPGTDEGWVYATLTPDGKKVTSAGRVQSCMACHRKAPHHRLFGLKKARWSYKDPWDLAEEQRKALKEAKPQDDKDDKDDNDVERHTSA